MTKTSHNIIVSFPFNNQNVKAVITALEQEDWLYKYHTLVAIDKKNSLLKSLPKSIQAEFLRRSLPIEQSKVITSKFKNFEFLRLILNKFGFRGQNDAMIKYISENFDSSFSKHLTSIADKNYIDAVYGYEDTSQKTFEVAKSLGIKCIYDLPIAYWSHSKKLMKEEIQRLPEWKTTMLSGIDDSEEKLNRKEREIELADIIICASNFVKNSIPENIPRDKILISPFGTPEKLSFAPNKSHNAKRPLRVLFAGGMSQRKGLGDLFSAMKLLNNKNVELVVLGSLMAPMNFYRNQFANFIHEPGRPHEEVLKLMQTCDVFCLPSIVEGRALVMQEAMSQGLPLIITPNTGGDDLIIEGKTGFLIDIRSPEAIAEKIEWFSNNRDKIEEMGSNAKQLAISYTWKNYSTQILHGINNLLN